MGSFIQTLISFLRRLFGFGQAIKTPLLPSPSTALGAGSATPLAAVNPQPIDPSRAWSHCAWCDGLMSPDDYAELPSGEAVHISCQTKQVDQDEWLGVRQKMIVALQPAYPALGKTKEIVSLIFQLHPGKNPTLEDAFDVLRVLERQVRGLKIHDLRVTTAALAGISQARMEIRSFLKRT